MAISICFANADLTLRSREAPIIFHRNYAGHYLMIYLMKFMMIEGEIAQIALFEAGQLSVDSQNPTLEA
jgi:hypothetical protein